MFSILYICAYWIYSLISPPLHSLIMQYSSESYFLLVGLYQWEYVTADLCTNLSSELNVKVVFFLTLPCMQCYSGASCIEFRFLWQKMDVLSARDLHENPYFRYLAFDHSVRRWLDVSLLRGWFSKAGGLRLLLVGGGLRLLLVSWRIILPSACQACSAGNFCLLQKPDLFCLAVGTAADLWQAFWVVYAAIPTNILLSKRCVKM